MLRNYFRRLGGTLCFLFIILVVHAQYTVTGGRGIPLLANDDTKNRLQVYLVYGVDNVEISYNSSASGHQWFRYKKGVSVDKEPVASTQNGTTSVVRNVQEGYGYYVEEVGSSPRYVWVIDYSKYEFNIESLFVKYGNDQEFELGGTPDVSKMYYTIPGGAGQGSSTRELLRQFEVAYQTLNFSEENKLFSSETVTKTITGNPFSEHNELNAPLCDTEITLSGDLFARHFNVEKKKTTDLYQAVALFVYADTTIVVDDAPNMTGNGSEMLSAPVDVHFAAYVNDPVASLVKWKIYKDEDGEDKAFLIFPGNELDYTFNQFGNYTAVLTVSDRTGEYTDDSNTYSIKISESSLDVPNAFSPGTTPGINDEFRVAYRSVVNYKCWIFNRWGVQMYHSTNPAEGWDGKKGGKYVPPGVYFYIIEARGSNGESLNRKGSINILRPKNINDEVVSPE